MSSEGFTLPAHILVKPDIASSVPNRRPSGSWVWAHVSRLNGPAPDPFPAALPCAPHPAVPCAFACPLLFKLHTSVVLFTLCSPTFPKGLLPQHSSCSLLSCRLRLRPRRRGRAHGRHCHPEPFHTLLGEAREPQHEATGSAQQGRCVPCRATWEAAIVGRSWQSGPQA